jgi:alpha-ribazole phosphatase
MTRFWWVRHGPTHAKGMVGWTDLAADLSDKAALARLDAALPSGAVLVSSDLSRAIATADALGTRRHRLPHDPALREIHFGSWEMRAFTEVEAETPDQIRAFWDQPGDIAAPEGESWNAVLARVTAATTRLCKDYPDGEVIVVAHFGAILAALQHALSVDAKAVFANRIDNLSITRITLDGAHGKVLSINHKP